MLHEFSLNANLENYIIKCVTLYCIMQNALQNCLIKVLKEHRLGARKSSLLLTLQLLPGLSKEHETFFIL